MMILHKNFWRQNSLVPISIDLMSEFYMKTFNHHPTLLYVFMSLGRPFLQPFNTHGVLKCFHCLKCLMYFQTEIPKIVAKAMNVIGYATRMNLSKLFTKIFEGFDFLVVTPTLATFLSFSCVAMTQAYSKIAHN